jgi:DNA-binding response OmpR family regulator
LVEDDSGVALGVRHALEADGFVVDHTTNGSDGLDRLLGRTYALAILDILLPGTNGYELCRTARRQGIEVPILMLSAKSGEWDVAEGLDLGADDYLTKPFSTVELLARVRARVRGNAARLQTGDLRFEPDVRRCWRGDRPVDLTARETNLLRALFAHLGEVVSKEQLLAEAWEPTRRPNDPNAVEACIGRLRRKLDLDTAAGCIETIRGVGYRLPRKPFVCGPP